MAGLLLLEVDDQLLGLLVIQDQTVHTAPLHQPLPLLSVGQIIVVSSAYIMM